MRPIGGVEGPPDKENRSLATLRFSIWHSLADLYPTTFFSTSASDIRSWVVRVGLANVSR
jgi:hypothetical protein